MFKVFQNETNRPGELKVRCLLSTVIIRDSIPLY